MRERVAVKARVKAAEMVNAELLALEAKEAVLKSELAKGEIHGPCTDL